MSGSWAGILGPGKVCLPSWWSLSSLQDGGLKTDFLWQKLNGLFMAQPLQPLSMASTAPVLGEAATSPQGLQCAHAELTS